MLALIFCALLFPVPGGAAEVPYPPLCSVEPADALNGVILAPDSPQPLGACFQTVTIRRADGAPIENIFVEVVLSPEIVRCQSAVLTGRTNADGVAVVMLAGGGCLYEDQDACIVKANGIHIRVYQNVKSPDWAGSYPGGGDGLVNVADLVAFANAFHGSGSTCHDYDNSGECDVGDLPIFGDAFSVQLFCQPR